MTFHRLQGGALHGGSAGHATCSKSRQTTSNANCCDVFQNEFDFDELSSHLLDRHKLVDKYRNYFFIFFIFAIHFKQNQHQIKCTY
jgi:hypothetical protein